MSAVSYRTDYGRGDLTSLLAWRAGVPAPNPNMPPWLYLAARAGLFFGAAPSLLLDLIADPDAWWCHRLDLAERLQRALRFCDLQLMNNLHWAWILGRKDRTVYFRDRPYNTPLEALIDATRGVLDAFARALYTEEAQGRWPRPDWRSPFRRQWNFLRTVARDADEWIRFRLETADMFGDLAPPPPELTAEAHQDITEAWREAAVWGVRWEAPPQLLFSPSEGELAWRPSAAQGQSLIEECRPLIGRLARLFRIPAEGDGASIRYLTARSPDCRSVVWFGEPHFFTDQQAAAVSILWDAWEQGTPDVGQGFILDKIGSDSGRLSNVFGRHKAWGTMIVSGATKGAFCLRPPA